MQSKIISNEKEKLNFLFKILIRKGRRKKKKSCSSFLEPLAGPCQMLPSPFFFGLDHRVALLGEPLISNYQVRMIIHLNLKSLFIRKEKKR